MLQTYQQFQMYATFNHTLLYTFSKKSNFCTNLVIICAAVIHVERIKLYA